MVLLTEDANTLIFIHWNLVSYMSKEMPRGLAINTTVWNEASNSLTNLMPFSAVLKISITSFLGSA